MSFWGSVGSVLGSIGSGIGDVLSATLPTAIPAGLEYLKTRDALQAQRDIAKAQAKSPYGTVYGSQRAVQQGMALSRQAGSGTSLEQILKGGIVNGATPPYQQAGVDWTQPGYVLLEEGAKKLYNYFTTPGNGNGVAVTPGGGIQIATNWNSLFTPTGRVRGTVAVVNQQGRMEYMRNVGQPIMFSRDASICKRVRSKAGKAYRASGGGTSSKR